MKSSYIKIIMNKKNEIMIDVDICIKSLGLNGISNVSVKIDTGCPNTSIPIQKLGISKAQALAMKQQDSLDNSIKKQISFGVNDTKEDRDNAIELFKKKKYMKLKQITYIHSGLEINFGNMIVNTHEVKISYDRTGNILIGMDIMKDWDIHIGTVDTGETIFLACPKDKINEEYLLESERLFHIRSSIDSAIIRQKIEQAKGQII